jgi:hypothetical protein
MMVSFRFHLVLDNLMTLDIFVDPSFGFYGFLLATTMSLIACHVILYFHRRSLVDIKPSEAAKESLSEHEFQDKGDSQTQMTWLLSGLTHRHDTGSGVSIDWYGDKKFHF